MAALCLSGLFAFTCAASPGKPQPPGAADSDQSCSDEPSFAAGDPTPSFGCKAGVHHDDPLVSKGLKIEGLVHLRVDYVDGVEDRHKQAFRLAIEMWNTHRRATGFVFRVSTEANPDLLLKKGAPRDLANWEAMEDTQCAAYMTGRATIWYAPRYMDVVIEREGIDAAARIYAHELGHVLNICHKAQSLLMRDGDPNEWCHERAAKMPGEIPPDDIRDARVCGFTLWEREHKQKPRRSRRGRVISVLSARRGSLRSRVAGRRFRL
jgi:hypothetical protein